MTGQNLRQLLGLRPSSPHLAHFLSSLANSGSVPVPDVKSYPDAVYLNYYTLGFSLLFSPLPGYKPAVGATLAQMVDEKLALDSIDVYNIPPRASTNARSSGTSTRIAELVFSSFPLPSLVLDVGGETEDKDGKTQTRPDHLNVTRDTTGKDFVACLGEPKRKGGGGGPSSGSIGIWCEWSKDGLMVEFGGDEAKGPQAWERGKDAVWKVITLFSLE